MQVRNKVSKKDKVLYWLKQGKKITPLDALQMFGSFRLSSIIFELRKEYDIGDRMIKNYSGGQYKEYFLKGKNE